VKPKYEHDCSACIFLGSYTYQTIMGSRVYDFDDDLYVCPNGILGPTLLARHGDSAPDYTSMSSKLLMNHEDSMRKHLITPMPELLEALDRYRTMLKNESLSTETPPSEEK